MWKRWGPVCGIMIGLLGVGTTTVWSRTVDLAVAPAADIRTWVTALAEETGGQANVTIKRGRVDVLTRQWAIKVSRADDWETGIADVLRLAEATARRPVLAVVTRNDAEKRQVRWARVEAKTRGLLVWELH